VHHLTPEQLLDLAEGAADAAALAHTASCARCSADLAQLKATLAAVSEVEMPEPSPLFWDHFSTRVRDAIAEPAAGSWHQAPFSSFFLLRSIFGNPWLLASAAGVVVLVLAAVVSWRANGPVALPPGSQVAVETRLVSPGTIDDIVPAAPPDDASLELLADLTADLGWDDATEAGLGITTGSVDRIVAELSATERDELHRLLTVEMAGKVL
jgi:hypothetical protein